MRAAFTRVVAPALFADLTAVARPRNKFHLGKKQSLHAVPLTNEKMECSFSSLSTVFVSEFLSACHAL